MRPFPLIILKQMIDYLSATVSFSQEKNFPIFSRIKIMLKSYSYFNFLFTMYIFPQKKWNRIPIYS